MSNTFWSTQTAKYPNYGTTKKRRFHEINYLVENIQKMKEDRNSTIPARVHG